MRAQLLSILRDRFKKNMQRHEGMAWADVQVRIQADGAQSYYAARGFRGTLAV